MSSQGILLWVMLIQNFQLWFNSDLIILRVDSWWLFTIMTSDCRELSLRVTFTAFIASKRPWYGGYRFTIPEVYWSSGRWVSWYWQQLVNRC